MTMFAQWLDSAFAGFDYAVLGFMHTLAEACGAVLTPVMKLISFIGEKGIAVLLLAVILMCFSKTRKTGICIFGAVCCGALITSVCLKDIVGRIRPLEATETFKEWWSFVGAPPEEGFSFPSGHVTAAAAGVTALCLFEGKKIILPSVVYVVLMGASRNYLLAHYPSDVIAGIAVGVLSAVIAFFITELIYKLLESRPQNRLFAFVLDFDLKKLLKK